MNEKKPVERSDVADLLSFSATEDPSWRGKNETGKKKTEYPTVEQMITDIAKFQIEAREIDDELLKRIEEKFLFKYIFHVNTEGEHGVDTMEETKECIETVDSRATPERPRSQKEQETINVFQAYKQLQVILKQESVKKSDADYGILHIDIVKDLHKTILKGVDSKGQTEPGKCSDRERYTEYKGERYRYQNPENMDYALSTLLDRYNCLLDWLKKDTEGASRTDKLFKTCSWLLFEFLDLHPFADGNGRLGRLLCNYTLSVFSPFPTPVYNIWRGSSTRKEHYIDALVAARKHSKKHPETLTTMLIESNWLGWKEFLEQVKKEKDGINNT